MTTHYQTPDEIQRSLGERLRQMRLNQNLDQASLAASAGVSERTIHSLETGRGSTLITLIRVLKALGALTTLDALAPAPSISPMALAATGRPPQRARRRGKHSDG